MTNPNLGSQHPCFDQGSRHTSVRVHLPVAPRCNVQCKFCDRKFSCVNESRPGVTARVMSPVEALEYLHRVVEQTPNVKVVGIAGPGDPFANPDETLETLGLVKQAYPDLMLCVSTNGLGVMRYVDKIQQIGVSHITITVNAVEPSIGARIYDWVQGDKSVLRGEAAARLLWERQEMAIQALDFRGIQVKVNTVFVPGVNSDHVESIARVVAGLGATLHNIIPLIPTAHTPFATIPEPTTMEIQQARTAARAHLPQMEHCSRCRADAVGLVGQSTSLASFVPRSSRPNIAVCSSDGIHIDQHLGKSAQVHIFTLTKGTVEWIDVRATPEAHTGSVRWVRLAEMLHDCSALISSGTGPIPRSILTANGIQVHVTEGKVSERAPQLILPDRSDETRSYGESWQ